MDIFQEMNKLSDPFKIDIHVKKSDKAQFKVF